ncbi:MAG: DUF4271 domain-containing protein [Bacteroidetes bacterium]|nr:DUF4271 domain-containing protein [Bacteroidota bacterium]
MKFLDYFQTTNQLGHEQMVNVHFPWIFWILMAFNLVALAYVRTAHPGYITVLFRTGIYNRQLYQNVQEDLRLNSAGSVLLTMGYFNCFALIVSAIIPGAPASFTWIMVFVIAGVMVLKFLVIRLLGSITETREGLTEHWINHLIYFQIITLILTPALCFTQFLAQSVKEELILAMVIFIGILIFIREIQSFIRAIRQRIPVVYIILYLCTLELIPLVVLIRVLVR